ncbi:hypothetical protein ACHAXS_012878 [Conticribra weissflogii]
MSSFLSSRLPKDGNDCNNYCKVTEYEREQEDQSLSQGRPTPSKQGERERWRGADTSSHHDTDEGVIENENVLIPVRDAPSSPSIVVRESSPSFIERWTTSIFDGSLLPSCPGFLSLADDTVDDDKKVRNATNSSVAKVSVHQERCKEATGNQAVSLLDKGNEGSPNSGSTSPEGNIARACENDSLKHSQVEPEVQSMSSPRRKNRSRASKQIRTEKIYRLIEEIQYMPIPSVVRSQVLSVHELDERRKAERKKTMHTSLHSSSFEEDDDEDELWNPNSSSHGPISSYERQLVFRMNSSPSSVSCSQGEERSGHHSFTSPDIVAPLSSTISSPYYSPPASPTSAAYSSPASIFDSASHLRSMSTPRASSPPPANVTPSPIMKQRRAKSFDALFQPTPVPDEKKASTSILDWQRYITRRGVDRRSRKGQTGYVNEDEDQSNWIESVCSPCGYYASTQGEDSDNEIESISATRPRQSVRSARGKAKDDLGCGGYIDYSGVFHECNNVGRGSGRRHCQGCIFRRGERGNDCPDRNHHDNPEVDEELYYDSDPGQFFAVNSWSSPTYRPVRVNSSDASDNTASGPLMDIYQDHSEDVIEKAKSKWRLRSKKLRRKSIRRSKRGNSIIPKIERIVSQDDSAPTFGDIQPAQQQITSHFNGQQKDNQVYLYDYFSRKENLFGDTLKTGGFSTDEKDVGDCVQESLNSRWRLFWHVGKLNKKPNETLVSILPSPPPKLCDVWIERGFRRNRNEIVEPKLMWSEVTQPHLQKTRYLGESTARPYRVSLLAVRRIVCVSIEGNQVSGPVTHNVNNTQQLMNPFPSGPRRPLVPTSAKPDCLILLRSSLGDDYFFEASCKEERDRIVHLWKMTTARLVSHAVVGDGEKMIEEFFNESRVSGGLYASLVTDS